MSNSFHTTDKTEILNRAGFLLTTASKYATSQESDTFALLKSRLMHICQIMSQFISLSPETEKVGDTLYHDLMDLITSKKVDELRNSTIASTYVSRYAMSNMSGRDILIHIFDNSRFAVKWDGTKVFQPGQKPIIHYDHAPISRAPIKYQLQNIAKELGLQHQQIEDRYFVENAFNNPVQVDNLKDIIQTSHYDEKSANWPHLESKLEANIVSANTFINTLKPEEEQRLEQILNKNGSNVAYFTNPLSQLRSRYTRDTDAEFFLKQGKNHFPYSEDLTRIAPPALQTQTEKVVTSVGEISYAIDLAITLDEHRRIANVIAKAMAIPTIDI